MNVSSYWLVTGGAMVPMILVASWIDYRQHRIPNKLNLLRAASGLIVQMGFFGVQGLVTGAEGLALGLALLIVPWAMHLMGAGDVKLLAGVGAWLGPGLVLKSFVVGALIGGVAAVVMIVLARRIRPALTNLFLLGVKCSDAQLVFGDFGSVKQMGSQAQLLPYGVPLTAGTLLVLVCNFGGWW